MVNSIDIYIGACIMGLFTGLGSALGNYIANKHIIESINNLKVFINKNKEIKK
jgi:F0F1-type ATP synthase membrane subunit c/vacuolar-type H+-ATPase subunit K